MLSTSSCSPEPPNLTDPSRASSGSPADANVDERVQGLGEQNWRDVYLPSKRTERIGVPKSMNEAGIDFVWKKVECQKEVKQNNGKSLLRKKRIWSILMNRVPSVVHLFIQSILKTGRPFSWVCTTPWALAWPGNMGWPGKKELEGSMVKFVKPRTWIITSLPSPNSQNQQRVIGLVIAAQDVTASVEPKEVHMPPNLKDSESGPNDPKLSMNV